MHTSCPLRWRQNSSIKFFFWYKYQISWENTIALNFLTSFSHSRFSNWDLQFLWQNDQIWAVPQIKWKILSNCGLIQQNWSCLTLLLLLWWIWVKWLTETFFLFFLCSVPQFTCSGSSSMLATIWISEVETWWKTVPN